jgi:hypothetical protein
MGQQAPFEKEPHGPDAAPAGTGYSYRLKVWLGGEGWAEVNAAWEPELGWHYQAHLPPTDFTWLACAAQVAQAIAENCGVSVAITVNYDLA